MVWVLESQQTRKYENARRYGAILPAGRWLTENGLVFCFLVARRKDSYILSDAVFISIPVLSITSVFTLINWSR